MKVVVVAVVVGVAGVVVITVVIVAAVSVAEPWNASADADTLFNSPYIIKSWQIARLKTEVAQDMNTFQVTVKFQKWAGLDSSNVKSAPPTGAPNAAATPADVPAAIK